MNIREKIEQLKKKKRAIILAHYYQPSEIQFIADFVGDSLALATVASKTDAKVILFCGVRFMAETAKILSPDKEVLMPVLNAPCPLADTATADAVLEKKEELGGVTVVSYVNTNADVKSVSDICCTSANAANVVRSLEDKEILFVPDKNLGDYVQGEVPEKKLHLWDGSCPVHERFSFEDLLRLRGRYRGAKVAVHPESPPSVRKLADYVGSTSGIIDYCVNSSCEEFIIGTEEGILFELKRRAPGKRFYILGGKAICNGMKMTTLSTVLEALEKDRYAIELDEEIIRKAYEPIHRMIQIKRG